jgi:sec-independent protein translocase protein TatA
MMPTLGAPELIIILVIIVLIFGVGKLPEVGQALGKGIREFRGAADGEDEEDERPKAAAPARPAAVEAPRPAGAVDAPRQPAAPVVASSAPAAPVAAPIAPVAAPAAPATPATAPAAPAAPVAATSTPLAYTVAAGDTPDSIAKSHGVTVEELMVANGWGKSDRPLFEGDKVQIPAKSPTV